MTATARVTPGGPFAQPLPRPRRPRRFGEHAPALPPDRASVVAAVHTTLTMLAIGYILWTNFVIFNGGNLPLTSLHISDGSAGAGTFMLFIGDWIALLLFQILVNGSIEYVLRGLLQPQHRTVAPPVQVPVQRVPVQPPGWSVPVPTPSTPLSALLTDSPGATRIFVPPQSTSWDYQRELN